MTTTKLSFCRLCESACGIKVRVDDNRVTKIEPDEQHPVTRGYACVKGVRFGSFHHSPDRITAPQKRIGDRWETISWEQALSEIGQKMRRLIDREGPDSVALYTGSPMAYNFTATMMQNALVEAIGTRSLYGAGSQDCNNKFLAQLHMYGSPFRIPFPDLQHTQLLIMIGANPVISQGTFVRTPRSAGLLRDITSRGGRVVHVNPRRTESARASGEQVFLRPDADVFFMLGLLRELIHNGGVDHARVLKHMRGFDVLARLAEDWSLERCEKVTGVPVQTMRELAAAHRDAERAVLYCGTGLNQGTHGTLAFWILECINAVSGNLDRRGGTLVGEGMYDVASFLKKAGKLEREDRTRVDGMPSVNDTFPAGVLADEILTPGEGRVRALFNIGGNPLLTCPNGAGKLTEAFEDLELLVSIDLFRNESANLAHYILPTTSFLERPDLPMVLHWMAGTGAEHCVQYTDKVVEPPEGVREEAWIFRQLAMKADLPLFGLKPLTQVFKLMERLQKLPFVGKRAEVSSELLIDLSLRGAKGVAPRKEQLEKYPHGQSLGEVQPGTFLGQRVLTEDGKVNLAPTLFMRSAAEDLDAFYERELANRNRLKLITKRERLTHNSWMHNSKEFVNDRRSTNYVYVHPEDASARGLEDGSMAEVQSLAGKLRIPVKICDDMMPGSVALPHGWGHRKADGLRVAQDYPGVNVNLITPIGAKHCEKLSGMSQMTAIFVDVRQVEAQLELSPARV